MVAREDPPFCTASRLVETVIRTAPIGLI